MNDTKRKNTENRFEVICEGLRKTLPSLLGDTEFRTTVPYYPLQVDWDICDAILNRVKMIDKQVAATVENARPEVRSVVHIFLRWMKEETIVRIIGAGRARLAVTMPANRLAHGGARVYVQGDIIPLPHTVKGGGIIAASASGKTNSVLYALESARKETRDVEIVGIAAANADKFRSYCDVFIGIQPEAADAVSPLRALADNEEYVIAELLDAMVAAAGRLAGFTTTWWKLGHENIVDTGPYDYKQGLK